jgi:O-antigen ligase
LNTTLFNRIPTRRRLSATSRLPLTLLCLSLLFEYLRIHDIVPILGKLKIQTAFLALFVIVVVRQVSTAKSRLAPQSRLLLAFLALALVTFPLATNWFYAYQFAYLIALTLVGYFAIVYILRNERDLRTFLAWFIGIHTYLAMKGISGYSASQFSDAGYTSTGHVGGYFLGDENDLALALNIALPLAMYLFRQARTTWSRVCWGMGTVAILMTIVFTFSRGGFVGLSAMGLYWALTSRKKTKAIGVVALAAILVIAVAPPEYWARIETIFAHEDPTGTKEQRQWYWAAARRMFAASPIWGVGGDNGRVLMPEYGYEFPIELRMNYWGKAFHSMYYQLLAEFGLLGIVLIGSVLVLNARDLRQIRALGRKGRCSGSIEQLGNCLQLSWVGFLTSAAFISVLSYPHLYYLTALTMVVHRLALQESTSPQPEQSAARRRTTRRWSTT